MIYDALVTAVAVCIAAVPLFLIVWAGFFGLKLVKAVVYVPFGRAARRAELTVWGAYYDARDERKALAAEYEAAATRLRAEEKTWKDRRKELGKEIMAAERAHGAAPTPSNLLILDGLREELKVGERKWNPRAVQAELDRLAKVLTDFDERLLCPVKKAADGATKDREWYSTRALREPVMAAAIPECE